MPHYTPAAGRLGTHFFTHIHYEQDAAGLLAAASQVLGAAGDLATQAEPLRNQVDEFLVEVRAT